MAHFRDNERLDLITDLTLLLKEELQVYAKTKDTFSLGLATGLNVALTHTLRGHELEKFHKEVDFNGFVDRVVGGKR